MKKPSTGRSIGSFEAKTRLAELLRDAENGTAYVIRRRGKAVARLVPPEEKPDAAGLARLKDDLRTLRGQIRGTFDIKAIVREGRR
ncbi:MAG: type II toxin-antitoxin system Phd/YefM family antitoxin [Elusimicrobiota bacterium]